MKKKIKEVIIVSMLMGLTLSASAASKEKGKTLSPHSGDQN
jgi:hypothetical protein